MIEARANQRLVALSFGVPKRRRRSCRPGGYVDVHLAESVNLNRIGGGAFEGAEANRRTAVLRSSTARSVPGSKAAGSHCGYHQRRILLSLPSGGCSSNRWNLISITASVGFPSWSGTVNW